MVGYRGGVGPSSSHNLGLYKAFTRMYSMFLGLDQGQGRDPPLLESVKENKTS